MRADGITKTRAYEMRSRAVKLSRTYLRKAESMLHWDALDGVAVDPSYWDLLDEVIEAAFEIVSALPDDFFETTQADSFFGLPGGPINLSDDPKEKADKLVALLEERRAAAKRERRIALLEQVEGRTPEEAEAYLAKAASLRAGA